MTQETTHSNIAFEKGNDSSAARIITTVVPDHRRLEFLPRHFGARVMTRFEIAVYAWMGNLCPHYHEGLWTFIELSNGGAFIAPSGADEFEMKVDGNGFDATVNSEVAGTIVSAFALSALLWQGFDSLAQKHEQLLAFVADHPQSATIRRALD
jgi:hypothetical protein